MNTLPSSLYRLDRAVLDILFHSESVSEFELIKTLQAPPHSLLNEQAFGSDHALFQTHFLLFNCLFRLRDQGIADQLYDIQIESSKIAIVKMATAPVHSLHLAPYNERMEKLRTYYLDWAHFQNTSAENVEDMLCDFWQKYARYATTPKIEMNEALAILELETITDLTSLKSQYRKLCNIHHPDKGGDRHKFQQIQLAYRYLIQRA